jgi:hypothetical protein
MVEFFLVDCPHCQGPIMIYKKEINCGIFRHGVLKTTLQPIHPHLDKVQCDQLYESGSIYGCGKPFRTIIQSEDKMSVEVCDYI